MAGEYLTPVPPPQRAVADCLGCCRCAVASAVRRLLATYPQPA
jgi:hypothetical protein